MLRGPLEALPNFLMAGFQAAVSLGRLSKFLDEQDVQEFEERKEGISVDDAAFAWPSTRSDVAEFNVSIDKLELPGKGLCLVEGATAAGKTALLLALLSELDRRQGTLARPKRVSYAGQTPWLEAGKSIRDNILFGSEMQTERYEAILTAAQLRTDLEAFPRGDFTRVALTTLSGGQKARLTLARALYADTDVVFLDDPLAAVDAHVQRSLIFECLLGPLTNDRLIVLATHHAAAVRQYANVTLQMSNGLVTAVKLQSTQATEPSAHASRENEATARSTDTEGSETDDHLLHRKETRREGTASLSALGLFFKASGWEVWISFLGAGILMRFGAVGEQLWLRQWGENATHAAPEQHSGHYFVLGYAIILAFTVLVRAVQLGSLFYGAQKSGRQLHRMLMDACLSATPRWYDITPVGRIVNRFVSDMWTIDQDLPMTAGESVQNVIVLISAVGVVAYFVPTFLVPLIILVYVGPRWTAGFIASTRDMQRIQSTMASPIYSRFEEVMSGIEVVRAFSQEARLRAEMVNLTSAFMAHWWAICSIEVWLSVRIGVL